MSNNIDLEELLKEVLTDRYLYLRYNTYYCEWELSRHEDEFCTELLGRDHNLQELLISFIDKYNKKEDK